jgi:hypothetical protein
MRLSLFALFFICSISMKCNGQYAIYIDNGTVKVIDSTFYLQAISLFCNMPNTCVTMTNTDKTKSDRQYMLKIIGRTITSDVFNQAIQYVSVFCNNGKLGVIEFSFNNEETARFAYKKLKVKEPFLVNKGPGLSFQTFRKNKNVCLRLAYSSSWDHDDSLSCSNTRSMIDTFINRYELR